MERSGPILQKVQTTKRLKTLSMGKEKSSTERRPPRKVGLPASLPTGVQKSYFMLSDAERQHLVFRNIEPASLSPF